MVVYADILILLNFLVNYFLLLTVKVILSANIKSFRIILSAVVGALSSLYIFIPYVTKTADFLYKLSICALMAFVAFGYKSVKKFLKAVLAVFSATCLYAGIMIAIWHIFKPNGMVINNSVVYFNISPVFLISFTVFFYLAFTLAFNIFSKASKTAERCKITLFAGDNTANIDAIVDTGNSLEDIFGKSEIIIADKSVFYLLFGKKTIETDDDLKTRYRIVPCTTVTGANTLNGYRCDKAYIENQSQKITLEKPILAISAEAINDDYEAIVNPKIFN